MLPHCFGVIAGQSVSIENRDQDVHTFCALGNPQWRTLGIPALYQAAFRFSDYEGIVPIKCDVHPWERAWAGVFSRPCFSVTGRAGEFAIEDLTPGKYTLEVWHEYYESVTKEVVLSARQVLTQDFVLKRKKDS